MNDDTENQQYNRYFRPTDNTYLRRQERNRIRRETNQILRDITGTSARAAREDMGLARS